MPSILAHRINGTNHADFSSPRALVIRGRKQKRIAGREVVRKDILVRVQGDRIPEHKKLEEKLVN